MRVLAPVKANLARKCKALAFRIKTVRVASIDRDIPIVKWLHPVDTTSYELLDAKANPGSKAKWFLQDVLRIRPLAAEQVKRQARDAGISLRTLERAKKELQVKSKREGWLGEQGAWFWSLPK